MSSEGNEVERFWRNDFLSEKNAFGKPYNEAAFFPYHYSRRDKERELYRQDKNSLPVHHIHHDGRRV